MVESSPSVQTRFDVGSFVEMEPEPPRVRLNRGTIYVYDEAHSILKEINERSSYPMSVTVWKLIVLAYRNRWLVSPDVFNVQVVRETYRYTDHGPRVSASRDKWRHRKRRARVDVGPEGKQLARLLGEYFGTSMSDVVNRLSFIAYECSEIADLTLFGDIAKLDINARYMMKVRRKMRMRGELDLDKAYVNQDLVVRLFKDGWTDERVSAVCRAHIDLVREIRKKSESGNPALDVELT